ncbi:MAG: MBL fold metallo-hydrolase [Chitinivibrionales bacterium]|nr:MBL fold metallo-hydrolase [Chitinivibrionales bacterium]
MKLTCKQLNPGPCKTWLIGNDANNEVIFLDPVIEHVNDYQQLVEREGLHVGMAIDTHTHADHISGGASLKDMLQCEYGMHAASPVKCATFSMNDGFTWNLFDTIAVKVMHTPGHTRDSISLIFPDWIFTGDALFLDDGGAGRDDLPGGDAGAHWETLRKFAELDDELIVNPAHDYRDRQPSALKRQKETNPHLKKSLESRDAFVQYLEDLKLGPADWMKDVLTANYACARDPHAAWIPADSPACEVKGTMDISANEAQVGSIPPFMLKQKLAGKQPPLLIDVREPGELDAPLGHIEGVLNIPIGQLASRIGELDEHRDKDIVTVCRSGGRAYTAAQILSVGGFSNVAVLEGGMLQWNTL